LTRPLLRGTRLLVLALALTATACGRRAAARPDLRHLLGHHRDLAQVAAELAELMKDPLFRRLDVVRDGRDVYPEVEPAAALSFSSPLSLPLAIDAIVPQLAQAVESRR
jgi:hypothetical protein